MFERLAQSIEISRPEELWFSRVRVLDRSAVGWIMVSSERRTCVGVDRLDSAEFVLDEQEQAEFNAKDGDGTYQRRKKRSKGYPLVSLCLAGAHVQRVDAAVWRKRGERD